MPTVGMTVTYLGIDPGRNGGIAAISGGVLVQAVKMPETPQEVWDVISSHSHPFGETTHAVVEKVGGYAGIEHPGSAMFNFGAGYGGLIMALTAARIPCVEVPPQTWQKDLGLKRGTWDTDSEWKNACKLKAQELFPQAKVTLATADALLIAHHCRRLHSPASKAPIKPKVVTP